MKDVVMDVLMMIITASMLMGYLPQIFKLLKTKKSEDISFTAWLLFLLSSISNLAYGILLGRWEYILCAVLEFVLNLMTFLLTVRYRTGERRLQ